MALGSSRTSRTSTPPTHFGAKQYNLYSKIDTEAPRYLEFEQWWGAHVVLNADEMQFIADELFIGNKLATAELVSSDGHRFDLRNITSPIIVFCSKADNITPPPQALDWILDLYDSVDDIRAHGQTIVYAVHELIGHLGIFVSGSVAKKEHDQFASNIDLIDVLPPGLYEAVMTPKNRSEQDADLITGDYLVRFEARTLDDIRALGGNDEEDERKFAAAARVSEINLGLYRTFFQPWVRLCANEGTAQWMRQLHPLRMQYEMFSRNNPFMRPLLVRVGTGAGRTVLPYRRTMHSGKPKRCFQTGSRHRSTPIAMYAIIRQRPCSTRSTAHPWCKPWSVSRLRMPVSRQRPGKDAAHLALVAKRIDELKQAIPQGGPREAVIRALLYVRMPEGVVDERGFNLLRRMREEAGKGLTLAAFKKVLREQFFMLLLDERRAVEAIPAMLAKDPPFADPHGWQAAPIDRCGWAAQQRGKGSFRRGRSLL